MKMIETSIHQLQAEMFNTNILLLSLARPMIQYSNISEGKELNVKNLIKNELKMLEKL